jgi:hypothetical protein
LYRCAVEDKAQSTADMAQGGHHNNDPYHDAIHMFGCSRDESQIAETEGGLETCDADLVEGTPGIVQLHIIAWLVYRLTGISAVQAEDHHLDICGII